MEILPISTIEISPKRQRRLFKSEALMELAESIESKGLMHPPVLQNQEPILVSGERRLRAIQLLWQMGKKFQCNGQPIPENSIPILRLGELSPELIYEAQLEENIRRENLTPLEELSAIAELHRFRTEQDSTHTLSDTAAEVFNGSSADSRSTDIRDACLAFEHSEDPEIRGAKSKSEIKKLIERKLRKAQSEQLAYEFDGMKLKNSPHRIILGDARKVLRDIPDHTFDVFCSDPIYGIDADDFGDMADAQHSYDDSYKTWKEIMPPLAFESYRTAKPQAHSYIFCAWERFAELTAIYANCGWWVWPKPLIWNKGRGMLPRPRLGPKYTYELILFAIKGEKEVLKQAQPDVISLPSLQTPQRGAEKPVALYRELLDRSCLPGDHVCDFSMGTGAIFSAADSLKLHATGIDIDKEAYGMALTRLEEKL